MIRNQQGFFFLVAAFCFLGIHGDRWKSTLPIQIKREKAKQTKKKKKKTKKLAFLFKKSGDGIIRTHLKNVSCPAREQEYLSPMYFLAKTIPVSLQSEHFTLKTSTVKAREGRSYSQLSKFCYQQAPPNRPQQFLLSSDNISTKRSRDSSAMFDPQGRDTRQDFNVQEKQHKFEMMFSGTFSKQKKGNWSTAASKYTRLQF